MGKKKKNAGSDGTSNKNQQEGLIWVDPTRVRFQHSKIRPLFSGCGRSIYDTLDSIRKGEISPSDLPPIQVIVGPKTDEGPWYFSLNNRRLWVLKRCREEGLLTNNNQIQVRVRPPKSSAEEARYSLENCALEAKVMREPEKRKKEESAKTENEVNSKEETIRDEVKQVAPTESSEDEDEDDSDSDDEAPINKNRFSALF